MGKSRKVEEKEKKQEMINKEEPWSQNSFLRKFSIILLVLLSGLPIKGKVSY